MYRLIVLLFLFFFSQGLDAQQINVLHYHYQLHLSDVSDTLKGTAFITVKFLENTNRLNLNLASVSQGRGMRVHRVTAYDTNFSFTHSRDTVSVALQEARQKGDTATFAITYAGIPSDGLIISKNKYNERTFFADNWPNRAHQWLPCNDSPDDKATVEFDVTAPAHYTIISNGILLEEKAAGNDLKRTHWTERISIPTKVMVIGAARFAVKHFSDSTVTPVSAWVYPKDSVKGFYDYALAPSIVRFFSGYVGPYPFKKLANVQSKTIFGGMENAGCIFYAENTVTGTRSSEALVAHEIAHQWFGNSATERSFAHLWLSESFATYLTHLYIEQKYDNDSLVKRLKADRKKLVQFTNQWPFPVVDSVSALMDLLNANSYEKGSWVLHMLRGQVGDSVFQTIIRTYYDRYKFSNADTWDFEKVAEQVSGKDLKPFFDQWLRTRGIPKLRLEKKRLGNTTTLKVIQAGAPYQLLMTIGLVSDGGHVVKQKIPLISAETEIKLQGINTKVILDPDTELLFEEVK